MIIGIPKEIKIEEYRVSATPMGVATLTQAGHKVLVQAGAGKGSGFADDEYVETTRPTSHSDPVYVVDGVIHYCVTNIPAIVPQTSTMALTNATLPYALNLANKGFVNAVNADNALAKGVNVYKGRVICLQVAAAVGIPYTPLAELI